MSWWAALRRPPPDSVDGVPADDARLHDTATDAPATRFPWQDQPPRGGSTLPQFGRRATTPVPPRAPVSRPATIETLRAAPAGVPPAEPPPRSPDPPPARHDPPVAPPVTHQRPWRDAAESLLKRIDPPSLAALRADWPAWTLRAVTYSGAILLAGSLLLATLPPLLSDTSTRAVVNAPINLVTAPIDGELERLTVQPGEAIGSGQALATLRNERLDRSTLIGLQNQTSGTRVSLAGVEQRLAIAETWVITLDTALATHRDHAMRMAQEAEREARARAASIAAQLAEQSAIASRQRLLYERGVVTESVPRIAALRERGAREELIAAQATLARRSAERRAIENGSYVGDGQGALGALVERKRDTLLDINRMRVEREQLRSSLAALEAQTAVEEARFAQARTAEAVAATGGRVLRAFASPGQRVAAGDTIAGTVECGRAFVVAIFSVRQAHRLPIGTRVRMETDGWAEKRRGFVAQVMPRTTDRVDTGYAVPFPPMERREMYVLIDFDDMSPRRWSRGYESAASPSVPCDIGRWVNVEIEGDGLAEATLSAWRFTRRLVASMFGSTEAIAR